jgi:Splicing factor SF3a60 binding domain
MIFCSDKRSAGKPRAKGKTHVVAEVDARHGWTTRRKIRGLKTQLGSVYGRFVRSCSSGQPRMDSIIELQRQTHEEIERYEQALYTILSRPQNVHQNRLQNEHKASQALDRISSRVTTLNSIYKDEDVRRTEINAISTPSQPGDLSEFYARLGKVQEHHNKYPDAGTDAIEFEIAALLDEFNPEDYDEEEAVYEDREFSRLSLP